MVRRRSRFLGAGAQPRSNGTTAKRQRRVGVAPWEGKSLEGEAEGRLRGEINPQGRGRSKPRRGCKILNADLNLEVGTSGVMWTPSELYASNGREGPSEVLAPRGVGQDLREKTLKGSQNAGGEAVRVAPNTLSGCGKTGECRARESKKHKPGAKNPIPSLLRSFDKPLER